MTNGQSTFEFDVALTFAGEDRTFVEDVATALGAVDITYFLDSEQQADMWGEDLAEYFEDLFTKRARFALMFISRAYIEKPWARHERKEAIVRQIESRSPYVLPVRLESVEVPGLPASVAYLDARRVGIDGLVRALTSKIAGSGYGGWPGDRVPRTPPETRGLLASRPGGWEYMYFAAKLLEGRESLEPRYRDHDLRLKGGPRDVVEDWQAGDYCRRALDDLSQLAHNANALLSDQVNLQAFGAPGEPGDSQSIDYVTARLTHCYEGFLDFGLRIRTANRPAEWEAAFEALSRFADRPIRQYREWVDEIVAEFDRIPVVLATGGQLHAEFVLTVEIDPQALARFSEEIERFQDE